MGIVNRRSELTLRIQVVFAIASRLPPLTPDEVGAIRDSLAGAVRGLHCTVGAYRAGGHWVEAMLDTESTFELARAVTSLKAVTSRRLHAIRGGPPGIWEPGYVAHTIGQEIDPSLAAADLAARNASRGASAK